MTTIVQPRSFPCPACGDPIFDDWYPKDFIFQEDVVPTREFWSDNAVIAPSNEMRSLVACPICSAVFPYFAVKSVMENHYSKEMLQLDEKTPFLRTSVYWQGSAAEDYENVVVLPDQYTWRIVSGRLTQTDDLDPLFKTLLAESIIQTFNDLVRNQVRNGEKLFGVAGEEELLDFLRVFVDEAQAGDAETDWSEWAGCETWEFLGITRYNMLVAEIDRYLGNFDRAFERLTMIQTHIVEMMGMFHEDDEEVDGVDYAKEYEDDTSTYNWGIEVTLARVAIMLRAVENKESSLVLIHSDPISDTQVGRLII